VHSGNHGVPASSSKATLARQQLAALFKLRLGPLRCLRRPLLQLTQRGDARQRGGPALLRLLAGCIPLRCKDAHD
jgi:hypothetical protein